MDLTTLPFGVGSSFADGGTIDSTALGGDQLEGREFRVQDVNPTTGVARTNRERKLRIVRNTSAAAILPKQLVTHEVTAGGDLGQQVDGLITVEAGRPGGFADEYLPAAGAPVNDLFYIVVEGPTLGRTSLQGGAENSIAVNDRLVGATAVTSGSTTSGRIKPIDLTGATTPLANQIMHEVGRAMSARTTANTNADILIDAMIRW